MIKLKKIPVVILNGFLGSGKTTLFRNLLYQSKKKNITVGGIVNDMSELDIDGKLLGNTDAIEENLDLLESIHSCVLSSKKGIQELDLALKKLLINQNIKLIIIETSGSCHPLPLVEYFRNQNNFQLTKVFTLIDCLMLAHDYQYGKQLIPKMQNNLNTNKRNTVNLLVEQIMFCNHLILTKADRIENKKLQYIASQIQSINRFTSVLSVNFGKMDLESLFDFKEYDYFRVGQLVDELKPILESEIQADEPYNITSRVITDDRPFHPQRLWNVCHQYLDDKIYRSKGFFWLATRDKYSLLWNQAAGGINLEIIGSWRAGIIKDQENGLSEMEMKILEKGLAKESGRFGDRYCDLTVIGDITKIDRFTNALKSCFLSDQEIEVWKENQEFEDPWPKNIIKMIN